MRKPLDYRNPKSSATSRGSRSTLNPGAPAPRTPIAVEFDTLLTQTEDHAAARSIESALRRRDICFQVSDDAAPANRKVMIYVMKADFEVAAQVAGEIFARRRKIKSFPRPQIPDTGSDRSDWIDPNFLSG